MLIVRLSAQTYKAFLPAMIANNHGHLVSIASSAGLVGVTGLAGQFLCHEFQFNVSNIFMIIFEIILSAPRLLVHPLILFHL